MPKVIHFEIHADDPQRASKFYSTGRSRNLAARRTTGSRKPAARENRASTAA
jgi:predicted enzyme related to lactoylglutathione lyase